MKRETRTDSEIRTITEIRTIKRQLAERRAYLDDHPELTGDSDEEEPTK